MCPECGSDNLRAVPYDFGSCSQTGYADAGERFVCRDCGATGEASEIDAMLAEAGVTFEERGAWHRLTRKDAGKESSKELPQKIAS